MPKRRIKVFLIVGLTILAVMAGGACLQAQTDTGKAAVVLIQSPTLTVTCAGGLTSVKDVAGGQAYTFTLKRVRRSDAPTEPHRAVTTATMLIDTLPGGGLRITDLTAGQVYVVTPKRG